MNRVTHDVREEKLKEALVRYQEKALLLGASQARVVKTSDIPVDGRVSLKCQVPRCPRYGICANCPPHALKPADLRAHLKKFNWAVFFTRDVPAEVIVSNSKERVAAYQDIFRIVQEIEGMAFYDGFYLAVGFGAGSCKSVLCGQHESCIALDGQQCRFPFTSRPSMEAVGINVFQMISEAGWEVYPIGHTAKAPDVPKGSLAGIVIVH